jgi:hypothetical protein
MPTPSFWVEHAVLINDFVKINNRNFRNYFNKIKFKYFLKIRRINENIRQNINEESKLKRVKMEKDLTYTTLIFFGKID